MPDLLDPRQRRNLTSSIRDDPLRAQEPAEDAAAELFETTGEDAYHTIFKETFVYGTGEDVPWYAQQYEAAFAYANSTQPDVDVDIQQDAIAALVERADWLLENGSNSGFGFLADPYAPYGWGNTASQPTQSSEIMLRVHALTGDDKYLNAAQQDVDYAFGANPMNMSFVTGLDQIVPDVRQPEEILDADTDVLGVDPKPGITLYGEYNIYDYGWGFYHGDMWEDTWPNYYDAPAHESWNGNYSYVPVTEFTVMQGMEDMTFVTGYLSALADDSASGPPTDPVPDPGQIMMQSDTVRIQQESADYWERVDFDGSIENPIVVMGPASQEGNQPFAVRVRNVDETGFEFQIDEWSYLDGSHLEVSVSWMAGTEGTYSLEDGTQIEFGTSDATGRVALSEFDDTPVVFGQLDGEGDGTPLTHRIKDVDEQGFDYIVQAEEALTGQPIQAPSLNYVAILDAADGGPVEAGTLLAGNTWTSLPEAVDNEAAFFADMQTMKGNNTATLRFNQEDVENYLMRVTEERSLDKEIWHQQEEIAYLSVEEDIFFV